MVVKRLLQFLSAILLFSAAGCQTVPIEESKVSSAPLVNQLEILIPPVRKVPIAVYQFGDLTGQRKPSETLASFSTAVTQGAHVMLIQALKKAGNGEWFQVVERVGLDNLLKERQIIRNTREQFEGLGDDLKEVLNDSIKDLSDSTSLLSEEGFKRLYARVKLIR